MDRLVRAFPLLPGKRDVFHAFTEEVRRRSAETAAFYNSYGIVRESWHLQETAAGDLIICCTDIVELPRAASAYALAANPEQRERIRARLSDMWPDSESGGPRIR